MLAPGRRGNLHRADAPAFAGLAPGSACTACVASAWVVGTLIAGVVNNALRRRSAPPAIVWGAAFVGSAVGWRTWALPVGHSSAPSLMPDLALVRTTAQLGCCWRKSGARQERNLPHVRPRDRVELPALVRDGRTGLLAATAAARSAHRCTRSTPLLGRYDGNTARPASRSRPLVPTPTRTPGKRNRLVENVSRAPGARSTHPAGNRHGHPAGSCMECCPNAFRRRAGRNE